MLYIRSMRYSLLLLFFGLGIGTGYGQVDSASVSFIAYWSLGDRYDYQITKIKEKWEGEKLINKDSSSYTIQFVVVDSTDTSYTIKWIYNADLASFNLPKFGSKSFLDPEEVELIYKTTETGQLIGIENWEDIAKILKRMVASLLEDLNKSNTGNKEDIHSIMQPILKIFESKEGIEELVFKELRGFHFPMGLAIPSAEPVLFEEDLSNLLGG